VGILRTVIRRIVNWSLRSSCGPFAARGENVHIAEPFTMNYPERVFLGRDIYIGGYAVFNSAGGIRIGDGCVFGPFVHIYTANHRYEDAEALPFDEYEYFEPVDVGPNVWIGGDAVLLPGVTVGEGAVIAAGAVVVKDVPAGAVVGGLPARLLKSRDMDRYRRLKAEGQIINALVGAGRNRPKPIGGVPKQWFLDAGLPAPSETWVDAGPNMPTAP